MLTNNFDICISQEKREGNIYMGLLESWKFKKAKSSVFHSM